MFSLRMMDKLSKLLNFEKAMKAPLHKVLKACLVFCLQILPFCLVSRSKFSSNHDHHSVLFTTSISIAAYLLPLLLASLVAVPASPPDARMDKQASDEKEELREG